MLDRSQVEEALMSQVTIYMDEDAISSAKDQPAPARLSLRAWITQLVKEHTPAVDANGYPNRIF